MYTRLVDVDPRYRSAKVFRRAACALHAKNPREGDEKSHRAVYISVIDSAGCCGGDFECAQGYEVIETSV